MVVLKTPHGTFNSTLFGIADKIPERLAALSENGAGIQGNGTFKEDGYPFTAKLELGSMSYRDCMALDLILSGAAQAAEKNGVRTMLEVARDEYVEPHPECSVEMHLADKHFSAADAKTIKQKIRQLREDILDSDHYSTQNLVNNDGDTVKVVERAFSPEEEPRAALLRQLFKAYGKEGDIVHHGRDPEGNTIFLAHEDTFHDIAKAENITVGRPRGASSTTLRFG